MSACRRSRSVSRRSPRAAVDRRPHRQPCSKHGAGSIGRLDRYSDLDFVLVAADGGTTAAGGARRAAEPGPARQLHRRARRRTAAVDLSVRDAARRSAASRRPKGRPGGRPRAPGRRSARPFRSRRRVARRDGRRESSLAGTNASMVRRSAVDLVPLRRSAGCSRRDLRGDRTRWASFARRFWGR